MGSFEVEPLIKEKGGNVQERQEECERRKRERDKNHAYDRVQENLYDRTECRKGLCLWSHDCHMLLHHNSKISSLIEVRSHDHTSISAVCYLLQ